MTIPAAEGRAARARWGRNHGGYVGNRLLLAVGQFCLPLGYAAVKLTALGFFVWHARARRASRDYLPRVLGPKNPLLLACYIYKHLDVFGKMLIDRAVALATEHRNFRFTAVGLEHLKDALRADAGVLMLTAHVGAAEMAAPLLRQCTDRPLYMVMYRDPADTAEHFHEKHQQALQDVHVISTTEPVRAGLQMLAALRQKAIVGVRADRALTGKTIEATLLGQPVALPAGPFLTAILTGVPVLSTYVLRVGYRHYEMVAFPPRHYTDNQGPREDTLRRAAADYAADLESILLKYPYQWFNFYKFWETAGGTQSK